MNISLAPLKNRVIANGANRNVDSNAFNYKFMRASKGFWLTREHGHLLLRNIYVQGTRGHKVQNIYFLEHWKITWKITFWEQGNIGFYFQGTKEH